jgi:hypothetical protein
MPDITMCTAKNCDKSAACYRHEDSGTEPNPYRQSYSDFNPENCGHYWPAKYRKEGE